MKSRRVERQCAAMLLGRLELGAELGDGGVAALQLLELLFQPSVLPRDLGAAIEKRLLSAERGVEFLLGLRELLRQRLYRLLQLFAVPSFGLASLLQHLVVGSNLEKFFASLIQSARKQLNTIFQLL